MNRRRRFALTLFAAVLFANIGEACTVFTITTANHALLANNEDFNKRGAIWFVPAGPEHFGRVNVGFHDSFGKVEEFAQGSMNEKGLAFDAMVVAKVPWQPDPNQQTPENLVDQIMDQCKSVAQAVEHFGKYNCPYLATTQFMFADASGASAVIAWDPGQGLSVVMGAGAYQVATNTRIAASGYRCPRAMRVTQVLNSVGQLDNEAARRGLQSVHQRGPGGFTSYACIYDLRNQTVLLYNLTNYDEAVEFDLPQELSKGETTHLMKNLFDRSPSLKEVRAGQQRTDFDTRVKLPPEDLQRFSGQYVPDVAPDIVVRVEATEDGLLVHNPGQPPATLYPEGRAVFRLDPDRGQVTFQLSEAGAVTGLTLHNASDIKAKRIRR